MAFYKQDIVDINLNTGSIFRSFLNHSIGFKNDDADRFGIRCFRDGEPVDLSGASCQAVFMAPNGVNIALTSYGTVSGNVAYVTLPPACYDYEGQFCLSIQLVGGGVTGTMRIVDGMVVNTGASGAVAPTASVPTYQEIIAQYDAMVAATSAANLAIAETFDATKAYPAGKYVINEGHLYRLTADHAANVTWANTSKVATNFGDDLTELKSAKVNIPLDGYGRPTYGTNGQSLRTKGNGETEWADVGLPTDEQTAEAVTAWLNDHPEATTTVNYTITTKVFSTVERMIEDLSLHKNEKVKTIGYYEENDDGGAYYYVRRLTNADVVSDTVDGTTSSDGLIRLTATDEGVTLVAEMISNGEVVPEMFGAYGDGSRNDTEPIQNAIIKFRNVRLNRKTYIVKGVELLEGTFLHGSLESIIKLAPNLTSDDYVTDATDHPFNGVPVLYTSYYSQGVNNIILRDFKVDGNYSNQISVYANSPAVYLNNGKNNIIDNIVVENAITHGIVLKENERSKIINCSCIASGGGYYVGGDTRYSGDGINLIFHCVDCVVENCQVINGTSIGIELEGRFGGVIAEARRNKNCKIVNCTATGNRDHNYLILFDDNCSVINCTSKNDNKNGLKIIGCKNTIVDGFVSRGDTVYGITCEPETYGDDGVSSDIYINANIEGSKGIYISNVTQIEIKTSIKNILNNSKAIEIHNSRKIRITGFIEDNNANTNYSIDVEDSSAVTIADVMAIGMNLSVVYSNNITGLVCENSEMVGGGRFYYYGGSTVTPVFIGIIERGTTSNLTDEYGTYSNFRIINNVVLSS